jgi:hypothetical protein
VIDTNRSKNKSWTIGSIVKIGFLQLKIVGVKSIVDGLPDIYQLTSLDGTKAYEFIPHNGLHRIN